MKQINPRADLGTFTFLKNYARFLPEQNRRENRDESIDRMMDMHVEKYADVPSIESLVAPIRKALKDKKMLGSQRSLQFGGSAILRKEMRIYNCSYSFFDRVEFLSQAVWLLLCGCGTGFSVQKHHIAKLPKLAAPKQRDGKVTYFVQDSIEGWADAFHVLFESYVPNNNKNNWAQIRFDYSQIRPEGSVISSSSSKAPGAKALKEALENVRGVLDAVAERGGEIRPIDAYDMVMHAAMCVRAGGIRRSATIALFSPDDEEMTSAKTGNWFADNPQRRLSNNSALLVRKTASRADFHRLMESTQHFGEPGFFFSSSTEHGTNPCAEIGLDPVDERTGETGWAMCNLTSVNVGGCRDEAEFLDVCYLAGALGTLQAGYTSTDYLGPTTKYILERDSLLGVSLTGMADRPDLAFNPELLRAGVDLVRSANIGFAAMIGIPTAARLTTVKPEGSGSLDLCAGNGIHPHHHHRYLRHVEAGKPGDPLVEHIRKFVPEAIVPSAYNPEEVKIVFPIDLGSAPQWLKRDTTALSHLEKVKLVQENWVLPGTVRGNLTHNVSNTIQVGPDEWAEVEDYVWKHRDTFGGVAMLGASGDLDYEQAPFIEVLDPDEIHEKYRYDPIRREKAWNVRKQWLSLMSAWQLIDWAGLLETSDRSGGVEVVACAGGACSF